jgi:hypothetical protein
MNIELTSEQTDAVFLDELKYIIEQDPCYCHQEDIDDWEEMKAAAKILLKYYL